MFSYKFSLSFMVGILWICSSVGGYHIKKCAKADKQALLKLKDGFIVENAILSSWNGEDCCKWKGVTCNNLTGHVISLDIQYLATGKLDSAICELQHLTTLSLSYINLKGEIPKCIGSLNQLIELQFVAIGLVGMVPPSLGNLSNLKTLDLGSNNLVANDLKWLSHLSNLRYLDLSYVNLCRAVDWLSSISKIPSLLELRLNGCGLRQFNLEYTSHVNSSDSLKILHLSGNNLNFSTLSWVLNVSKVLTDLYLSDNSLHSIPDSFANMISLQFLDLSYNSLHSIPDVFANMTSLQGISLSYNELEDSIPKSFQSLCQLKLLSMDSNKLSGQLSDWIRQFYCAQNSLELLTLSDNPFISGPLPDFSWLSCLEVLSLRNTNIVGSLPQLSGHLPHLGVLVLSFNQLSGSLPLFDVRKMASLKVLHLAYNRLNGTLPNNIGQLSNLRVLRLASNKLNGAINEAHLSNLSGLTIFEVAENSLSFNLSSNWVPPFQLYALLASSCILGPKFPTWLKHQKGLAELDISNSGISDSFPKWFWNLSLSLAYLNVSHNKLSGALPKSLQGMKIMICDFSFNNWSGPLPPFSESQVLFLSNNMFSGSVSSFCATSPQYLTYLDLSNNLLVGSLSNCWVTFQQLQVLNLAKNSISGRIPNAFGTLRQMRSMHLNNNNFSGEIPSLILCGNLTVIDFGDNNLEGTLPAWIGHHLHHLIVLRLHGNKLKGSIPASLCNLSFLRVLDLSKNNIRGEIPQCLNHIIALSNMTFPREPISYDPPTFISGNEEIGLFIDRAILAWKGENREYGKILGFMTTIDLSSNHLIGEIPQSITKLVALAGLNLSGNNLTGIIPNNIGHMEMLESLDLSRNRLHGRMPESFSNLTFLSYMNLSVNNLSGKIPLGTQLQSFNASSYEGNSGLCGPPLTSHCPEDAISPTGSLDKHVTTEDDDELITFGFYISLGLGFFAGFWGVCGTLIIKTSWRHAYFQFFNNMNDWIHVKLVIFMVRMKRRFQNKD